MPESTVTKATRDTLTLDRVNAVYLRERNGNITGVVSTDDTEYDVRRVGRHWVANDDQARNFKARSLPKAIMKAEEAR